MNLELEALKPWSGLHTCICYVDERAFKIDIAISYGYNNFEGSLSDVEQLGWTEQWQKKKVLTEKCFAHCMDFIRSMGKMLFGQFCPFAIVLFILLPLFSSSFCLQSRALT